VNGALLVHAVIIKLTMRTRGFQREGFERKGLGGKGLREGLNGLFFVLG
jgi:hypothetical protein